MSTAAIAHMPFPSPHHLDPSSRAAAAHYASHPSSGRPELQLQLQLRSPRRAHPHQTQWTARDEGAHADADADDNAADAGAGAGAGAGPSRTWRRSPSASLAGNSDLRRGSAVTAAPDAIEADAPGGGLASRTDRVWADQPIHAPLASPRSGDQEVDTKLGVPTYHEGMPRHDEFANAGAHERAQNWTVTDRSPDPDSRTRSRSPRRRLSAGSARYSPVLDTRLGSSAYRGREGEGAVEGSRGFWNDTEARTKSGATGGEDVERRQRDSLSSRRWFPDSASVSAYDPAGHRPHLSPRADRPGHLQLHVDIRRPSPSAASGSDESERAHREIQPHWHSHSRSRSPGPGSSRRNGDHAANPSVSPNPQRDRLEPDSYQFRQYHVEDRSPVSSSTAPSAAPAPRTPISGYPLPLEPPSHDRGPPPGNGWTSSWPADKQRAALAPWDTPPIRLSPSPPPPPRTGRGYEDGAGQAASSVSAFRQVQGQDAAATEAVATPAPSSRPSTGMGRDEIPGTALLNLTRASENGRPMEVVRQRRTRNLMTNEQIRVLSNLWEETHFPTLSQREETGAEIALSARQVQVWFQRQKARKAGQTERSPGDTSATPGPAAESSNSGRGRPPGGGVRRRRSSDDKDSPNAGPSAPPANDAAASSQRRVSGPLRDSVTQWIYETGPSPPSPYYGGSPSATLPDGSRRPTLPSIHDALNATPSADPFPRADVIFRDSPDSSPLRSSLGLGLGHLAEPTRDRRLLSMPLDLRRDGPSPRRSSAPQVPYSPGPLLSPISPLSGTPSGPGLLGLSLGVPREFGGLAAMRKSPLSGPSVLAAGSDSGSLGTRRHSVGSRASATQGGDVVEERSPKRVRGEMEEESVGQGAEGEGMVRRGSGGLERLLN